MENIHGEMYSILIDRLAPNEEEKFKLFHAIETNVAVKQKAKWAQKWITNGTFVQKLVAFAFVEMVFFSGSFCAIFWIKSQGIMPGLTKSNDFISRDEALHGQFACCLYTEYIKEKLSDEEVHKMAAEAYECEKAFILESLPENLIGMNSELMSQYIRYAVDYLLIMLGHPELYGDKNPFDFMERISLTTKVNFFENLPTQYQRAGVKNNESMKLDLTAENF